MIHNSVISCVKPKSPKDCIEITTCLTGNLHFYPLKQICWDTGQAASFTILNSLFLPLSSPPHQECLCPFWV